MKNAFFIGLLLLSKFLFSQTIIPEYPEGQSPYKDGYTGLFKDINTILIESKETPCTKYESYFVTLKINESGNIFLIRNKTDQQNALKNKCAYEMVVRVLGKLKNWQPAEIKGKKVTSYIDFHFIPGDYFDNFRENYDVTKSFQIAKYPGGMSEFRKDSFKNIKAFIDYDTYIPNGRFVLLFTIDENGKMGNFDMEPRIENSSELFEDIKFGIQRIKKKWEPAKLYGVPVISKFRYSLNFDTDY